MSVALKRYLKQLDADGARHLSMAQRLHRAAGTVVKPVELMGPARGHTSHNA